MMFKQPAVWGVLSLMLCLATDAPAQVPAEQVKDLSLLVAPELPCVWPVGQMPHAVIPQRLIGPSAYRRDLILIDEHTGTQFDAPAHFVPPPDSGLPGAGPSGLVTADKVPAWQFCGEACVIDVSKYVDNAPEGVSYLIRPDVVQAWEKEHRPLAFGDVVLFRSGYSDRYYQPFPAGDRFVAAALRKDSPGWPAPTPETMVYLAERGVRTLGLDSPSMGPIPDLAAATHQAGGQRGMIWTECATNLGALPATGAFYAMLAPKHAGGSGAECRALAITEPKLAARLIASARNKQVADLSVTLHEDYPVTWPGYSAGDEASRYVGKVLNAFRSRGPYFSMTHMLDGQAGTHVVVPGFSLPAEGFDEAHYPQDLRSALAEFQAKFGKRGTGSLTVEQVPLSALMGPANVIDVRTLVGTTKESDWPASPAITLELVKQHERAHGPIEAGDVVIFYSGYTDAHYRPLPAPPEVDRLFAAPLQGKAEGWPAPTPEVIAYLAEKKVRCIGTDGPTLGGVNRPSALFVYWLAASKGIFPVEYLINVQAIAGKRAFFLFAPVKIKGTAGGYGRAIALW